jgi:hypothetical protein
MASLIRPTLCKAATWGVYRGSGLCLAGINAPMTGQPDAAVKG